MNRLNNPSKKVLTTVFFAAFLLAPGLLGELVALQIGSGVDIQGSGAPFEKTTPVTSQVTGTIDVNMSLLATGTYKAFPATLARATMYNFTIASTGSASFDVSLVHNVTVTDYFEQETTSEYSDEILVTAGVPWWGAYNAWSPISFSSRVTQGVAVASGMSRSFLVYIDPAYLQPTIACTLLVILKTTADTTDNLLQINWNAVSLSTPSITVYYTNVDSSNAALFAPLTASLVKFGTQGSVSLTNSVLNETVGTNSSLTLVRWQKDLSGNVMRATVPDIGYVNDIYVPAFRNVDLDGSVLPAFIINANAVANARLTWNFSAVTDPSVTYASIAISDTIVDFTVGGLNRAFRVFTLNGPTYFDIAFTAGAMSTLLEWNLAVQFIAIGKDNAGTLNTLNTRGYNEPEQATLFATRQDASYQNSVTSFKKNAFSTFNYWIANHGSTTPAVISPTGTEKLGLVITATPSVSASLNLSCLVNVTAMPIPTLNSGEAMKIGTSLGYPFGIYEMFHVRQFTYNDFTQFKWGIQAANETTLNVESKLYCNDGALYPKNLNNALISDQFSTASLTGGITLQYEIDRNMQTNDLLLVYVKNETGTHLVATESGSDGLPEVVTIPTSGTWMQVIFNFTSNNQGNGTTGGPIIDDVRVGNTTLAAFTEDFQEDLSRWTQVDNTGMNALYWHISSEGTGLNRPEAAIIYPNRVYSLTGYYAEPASASFIKEVCGYNPEVQSSHVGYLVVMAEGNIVQNISSRLYFTPYNPIGIQDGTTVRSNLVYSQIGLTYPLADFYQYYYVDLEPGFEYGFTVEMEGLETLILDGNVISSSGTNASHTFDRFYGFFVVNLTYYAEPSSAFRIYFKFATIAPDTTITIRFAKVSTMSEFPWLIITIIASIAVNVIFGYVLAYNRRVITLPKLRKRTKI